MLRVHGLGDQVDRGLVGWQVTLRRTGKADGPVDNHIAVVVDEIAELRWSQRCTVLSRSPEHHLVPDKDTELLLKCLIRSCRLRGMFYYPRILQQYQEPAIAQYMLVSIEEVKRFNIALYKVCTTIYGSTALSQMVDGASMGNILLTADELQFPLPENHELWDAGTQSEWDRALEGMSVDGLGEYREEEWISKQARMMHVLGNI